MTLHRDIQIGEYTYQIAIDKNVSYNSFKCIVDYQLISDDLYVKNLYFLDKRTDINYCAFPINGEAK